LHLVPFLIEAFPEGLNVSDNDGKAPLQYLIATASHIEERGMVLLHRQAVQSKGFRLIIFVYLFLAYPEAIRLQDNLGLLPIHHACLNEMSSLDLIMLFVKLYQESIITKRPPITIYVREIPIGELDDPPDETSGLTQTEAYWYMTGDGWLGTNNSEVMNRDDTF